MTELARAVFVSWVVGEEEQEQEQGVQRRQWRSGQGLPKQREEVDDQAAPLVVGEVNKRDCIENNIGGKQIVSAAHDSQWDAGRLARSEGEMANARVCKKARRGHAPNPKVPRVEVELVPQLLSILSLANVSVSMLRPVKCLLLMAATG